MLDLETLGTKPGSVILALGAVKFGAGQIFSSFYERIDAQSCIDLGLTMDVSTVMWWLKQESDARLEITKPGKHINEVLLAFSGWVATPDAEIWGNGASFDNALLGDTYDRAQIKRPWKYSNDRCYRTMKNLWPNVALKRAGTHHNALKDAESQALHLMEIFEAANPKG